MTRENFVKQFEIWIKVFNSEAIISFVLDNMLRSQLEQNALTFIQSQKWENIKNLISHEEKANRNLGFSLLEGQISTQVRLFFEKSFDDYMEMIEFVKIRIEQLISEEDIRLSIESLFNLDFYGANILVHRTEEIFKKYDVNLEESQVFTSS